MLVNNSSGNYRFLAVEGRAFSNGIVADIGYDLVHATFERPLPLDSGLAAAARQVESAGRQVHAIAGFELRIPAPLTESDFGGFNKGYLARLTKMGLIVDGLMPAARTNVAAITGRVAEPSVYGVTYTVKSNRDRPAFLLSGAPEERAANPAAMIDSIMRALSARLEEIGTSWHDSTTVQLYAVEDVHGLLVEKVFRKLGGAAAHGIHWFPSRPPVENLRFEIDVRAVGTELVLPVSVGDPQ